MKLDTLAVVAVSSIIIFYVVVFGSYIWSMDHSTVRYDCRVAEISPDYPVEVKQQCRKLLHGRS